MVIGPDLDDAEGPLPQIRRSSDLSREEPLHALY
jgi:hypothetical protein